MVDQTYSQDADMKKTKTFAIPTPLARWFEEVVYEEPTGVVKKSWLYDQYVKFCKDRSLRPKHKQIFSKLVFTVFPRAGSCRLGSIGNQVPYYFGIKRRKDRKKDKKNENIKFPVEQTPHQHTRSTLGVSEYRMAEQQKAMWLPVEPKVECGKRKRDETKIDASPEAKKTKGDGSEAKEEEEDPVVVGAQLKERLLYLHRLLASQDADPYQVDVESYVCLFVERFWPELAPLKWDLAEEDNSSFTITEVEMNSFALCLCCSLFCGSVVKGDINFAREMLMLCSSLVNSLIVQMNTLGAPERLQKNFGVSLLFLARGLVDCSLFQNDMDAVLMAKNYCAMASQIFP